MKKILACASLFLSIVIGTVCLAACGSSAKWVCPEFSFDNDGLTAELVTNIEEDFLFPIEGLKLDHSQAEQGMLEYRWIIYNGDEIVGWIETNGGYEGHSDGKYKFGFSAENNNGVYSFSNQSLCVVLKSTDVSVFNSLQIMLNHGTASVSEGTPPSSATQRYSYFDEATNEIKHQAGAENFVFCFYTINFEGINPNEVENLKIVLKLSEVAL